MRHSKMTWMVRCRCSRSVAYQASVTQPTEYHIQKTGRGAKLNPYRLHSWWMHLCRPALFLAIYLHVKSGTLGLPSLDILYFLQWSQYTLFAGVMSWNVLLAPRLMAFWQCSCTCTYVSVSGVCIWCQQAISPCLKMVPCVDICHGTMHIGGCVCATRPCSVIHAWNRTVPDAMVAVALLLFLPLSALCL